MEVEWYVDPEFQAKSWGDINAAADRASGLVKDAEVVVDLGGGSGWFGSRLAKPHAAKVVSVDITPRVADVYSDVRHVKGSALDIPVRGSKVQIVTAHAILHHVPDELDKCITEVDRIMAPGGIMVAHEPLAGNPVATLVRRFVKTSVHEEGERPLSFEAMRKPISRRLKIEEVRFFFITTYLAAHIIPRLPKAAAGICRKMALVLLQMDRKMLANMPKTRKYAAYVHIVARKN